MLLCCACNRSREGDRVRRIERQLEYCAVRLNAGVQGALRNANTQVQMADAIFFLFGFFY